MPERFDVKDYEETWIACKYLSVVWVGAQRPFRESRARRIADKFDPQRFDRVRVTMPNGNGIYHVIDGQHRKGAVEMLWGSDEKVPCIILNAEDPAAAAKLFRGINGLRFGVDPISDFKVAVTAKEPTQVAVNHIVERRGYKVSASHSDNPKGGRNISAVGALVKVYEQNGPKVLDEILQIISATWPSDPHATSPSILRGYGQLLNEFGSQVNWGRLTDVIRSKYTPGSFLTSVREFHNADGGSLADAVQVLLMKRYNRGLPESKQLKRNTRRQHDE